MVDLRALRTERLSWRLTSKIIIFIFHLMEYTWSPEKRLANLKKHGLDFADVGRVFSGHTLTRQDHRFAYGEARFSTIGLIGDAVVVIAHTESVDEIRVISMRRAERHEREKYFASI